MHAFFLVIGLKPTTWPANNCLGNRILKQLLNTRVMAKCGDLSILPNNYLLQTSGLANNPNSNNSKSLGAKKMSCQSGDANCRIMGCFLEKKNI